jgi:AcrR family transcriptional regulator
MTSLPADSRPTKRFARKREQILSAAASLFNSKGFRGTTLADVARRVELITTSVTYYYKRKEDLAAACYVLTLEAIQGVALDALAAGGPEARIRAFITQYFEMLADIARGERAELVNFYELRSFTGPKARRVLEGYVELFKLMRRVIRADGADWLGRLETNARAHLFFSMMLWARTWIRQYEPDDYARVGERLCDILLYGFSGKGVRWASPTPANINAEAGPVIEPGPDAFLHAATELINEQGYHGASVERISARLNVTKGSFYHHIEGKDDLVAACFERRFNVVHRAQRAALKIGPDGWTQLTAAASALVLFQVSGSGPLLRYMALAAVPEAMRNDLAAAMQRHTNGFANMIADGVADGSIRPIDQAIAAHAVNGMTDAAADLFEWAPGADIATAVDIYARPLFEGMFRRA